MYNVNGQLLKNDFSENMTLDYAYDANTRTNYTVLRIFQTKRDGTKQFPFIRYPGRVMTKVLAETEDWEVVANCGLGVGINQPLDGPAIQNGIILNEGPATGHPGSIPLIIDANGNFGAGTDTSTASELLAQGAVFATCGFCPLIINFTNQSLPEVTNMSGDTPIANASQRTILGQWHNGDYAIISCAGRSVDNSSGWTGAQAQSVCQSLGLKFAYLCDGGASTTLYLHKRPVYDFMVLQESQSRVIPSFLVFNGTTNFGNF